MTAPTSPPPPVVITTGTIATVSGVVNRIVDFFVGELLRSREVGKLVSWAMIAGAGIFHSSLGTSISAALIGAGGLGHVAHAFGDNQAVPHTHITTVPKV